MGCDARELRGRGWGVGEHVARRRPAPCSTSCRGRRVGVAQARAHPLARADRRGTSRASRTTSSTSTLDLDGVTEFERALTEAMRRVPRGETVTYGELAALAGRPTGAAGRRHVLRAEPIRRSSCPCHRVVAADGHRLVRLARGRVQASAAGARRCRCLRISGTSWRGSRRAGSATGSPSSRGSRIPRAACTSAGAARSRSTSTSRARRRRAARSACCASWA